MGEPYHDFTHTWGRIYLLGHALSHSLLDVNYGSVSITGTRAIRIPQIGSVKAVLIFPDRCADMMMPSLAAKTLSPMTANSRVRTIKTGKA